MIVDIQPCRSRMIRSSESPRPAIGQSHVHGGLNGPVQVGAHQPPGVALKPCGRQLPDGHVAFGDGLVVVGEPAGKSQLERLPVNPGHGQVRPERMAQHGPNLIEAGQGHAGARQAGPQDVLAVSVQIDDDIERPAHIGKGEGVITGHGVERRYMKCFLGLILHGVSVAAVDGRIEHIEMLFAEGVVHLGDDGHQPIAT